MTGRTVLRLEGAGKVYPRPSRQGRLHSLKGALLGGALWRMKHERTGFPALSGVDLEVRTGETVAVIGPNGSGKSTLLKLAVGIIRPTAGTVERNGRVTALIELGAGFHPEISGRENAVINGMMLGLSRAEIEARLPEIVDFAAVGEFIDEPVKTYSSGMFVRLGFAVAVAADPDLLIVDEILAVGDESFQHRCLDRIAQLQRGGTAILLVSHDLRLVEHLARRALYLRGGRVLDEGPAVAVVDRYRSDVAAEEAGAAMAEAGAARWGNRAVTIESVAALGSSGEETRTLRSGERAAIRLRYVAHEPQDDFVFGVAVHREDGAHVFGTNTELDGWRARVLAGPGEVSIEFPRLELAAGRYLVDVAVHTRAGLAFDYMREALSILVTSSAPWPGSYAPTHRWVPAGPVMEPPRD
ncbi:MAG: ABC transporter ATP-binding protein [Acidobacteriota bacterium]